MLNRTAQHSTEVGCVPRTDLNDNLGCSESHRCSQRGKVLKHKGELFGANNLFKRLLRNAKLPQVLSPLTRSDVNGTKVFSLFTSNLLPSFGFSLAEVLITLGIIGLLAAMTIPTLLNSTQDLAYKASLKKNYSILLKAYQFISDENGGAFTNALTNCGLMNCTCFKDVFKQKMDYIKECDSGSSDGNCFIQAASAKTLNGYSSPGYVSYPNSAGLILKDGSSLIFALDNNLCRYTRTHYSNQCGWITVDVNGFRNPNTMGKDIFVFYVYDDTIRPASLDTYGTDDCNNSSYGFACASKYLAE